MPPRRQQTKRRPAKAPAPAEEQPAPETNGAGTLHIPRVLTVKELGDLMGMPPVEIIKELMKNGVMATINQSIDFETAAIVAHDLGYEPEEAAGDEAEEAAAEEPKLLIEEEEGVEL
ncbi:MAG: translation initiation factor IF-2 N-terminal domain-containing protein, partial [Dehalococcoidia bacterium]